MGIRKLLFRKRLKREETIAYLLREIVWVKKLEKQYLKLEEQIRKAQTDRNRLAARIIELERKKDV